jgi:hypothetical protein
VVDVGNDGDVAYGEVHRTLEYGVHVYGR